MDKMTLCFPAFTLGTDFSLTPPPSKTSFTRYNRLSNRLSNRLDNRLYRVNGVLERLTGFSLEYLDVDET